MNKNKKVTQSSFKITKVRMVPKRGHVDCTGLTHVWKVTGPYKTNKKFGTRKQATEWVKKVTDTTISK